MRAVRNFVSSITAAVAIAAMFGSRVAEAEDAGAAALPACISVGTESRYVPYGYNHIVLLKNGCSKAATCTVSTDVNPQASSVDVAAASSVEVLTFTGSPARTFRARVTCKLH